MPVVLVLGQTTAELLVLGQRMVVVLVLGQRKLTSAALPINKEYGSWHIRLDCSELLRGFSV